jgi:hypothetical protein
LLLLFVVGIHFRKFSTDLDSLDSVVASSLTVGAGRTLWLLVHVVL